jgi:hypothetical protein
LSGWTGWPRSSFLVISLRFLYRRWASQIYI